VVRAEEVDLTGIFVMTQAVVGQTLYVDGGRTL
jgi:hypothetical protein